ncbi:MAG: site-2 protease family protein [Anaerolineales bacterium]|nr:site-2 protease family protein [Chloroflexota bacterium]MBL6982114.1 site-2 protease family protein [Anaerolineales bacterium]
MTVTESTIPGTEEILSRLVGRVLQIEDTTWGSSNEGYLARFRGRLYGDSATSYEQLAEAVKPYEVTPLFKPEDERHVVYLMEGVNQIKPSNPWVNLVLFVLTLFSVLFAGALYGYDGPVSEDAVGNILAILKNIGSGWPFALSMLGILLAHEFGHYVAARYHKTEVTLPYFIPFPLSPFGTMGAAIRLKEPPKNKRVLLDIGAAGPLAGLVVAIPVLIYGLSTSEVHQLPELLHSGYGFEGNSILYLGIKFLVTGKWLPQPANFGGLQPLLYWLRYFFTGMPMPHGGIDITLNSVAWAGWAGLLVTALNLIPAGQLDGGHMIYVLLGNKARRLMPFILGALLLLGLVWSGWWLWAFLIFMLGRRYAEPLDQITTLDPRRRAVALLGIIIFVLVFTPVPLISPLGG